MIRLATMMVLTIASIAFVPALVNAAPVPNASKRQDKNHHALTLEEFINKVIAEGEDDKIGPNIGRVLGIDPDNNTKALEKFKEDCADNRYRSADVVVEQLPESHRFKPVFIILQAKRTRPGAGEVDGFKLRPDGSIEKAFRNSGKMTPDGHGVPGSAVDVDFDPDEAKALLKRELDFWLKGIGLKKKPAGAAAKKKPSKT